jgi:eukaryotic-like serine/threonine-protein kinase
MPMAMKVPQLGERADPAASVSFEIEQMILPRLSGMHVPKFVAAGDFGRIRRVRMAAYASASA